MAWRVMQVAVALAVVALLWQSPLKAWIIGLLAWIALGLST
jgi:hypothetical protein